MAYAAPVLAAFTLTTGVKISGILLNMAEVDLGVEELNGCR